MEMEREPLTQTFPLMVALDALDHGETVGRLAWAEEQTDQPWARVGLVKLFPMRRDARGHTEPDWSRGQTMILQRDGQYMPCGSLTVEDCRAGDWTILVEKLPEGDDRVDVEP